MEAGVDLFSLDSKGKAQRETFVAKPTERMQRRQVFGYAVRQLLLVKFMASLSLLFDLGQITFSEPFPYL